MTMMIDVAKVFSSYPSGRFKTDGTFNGERFRKEYLVPAFEEAIEHGNERVTVDIDGVRSFGSSFLEEAFAGLIRLNLFTKDQVLSKLEIRCSKPHLFLFRDAIQKYIRDAKPEPLSAAS